MISGEPEARNMPFFPPAFTAVDRAWETLAILERDFRAELLGMEVRREAVRIDVRIRIA